VPLRASRRSERSLTIGEKEMARKIAKPDYKPIRPDLVARMLDHAAERIRPPKRK
jgi:hypothetical protein